MSQFKVWDRVTICSMKDVLPSSDYYELIWTQHNITGINSHSIFPISIRIKRYWVVSFMESELKLCCDDNWFYKSLMYDDKKQI